MDTDNAEDLKSTVASAVTAAMRELPSRYLTFTQGVVSIVAAVVAMAVMGFGFISNVNENINKLQYQATISIDDRRDMHSRLDKTDGSVSEIKQSLATILEKLESIRLRQGK